MDYTRKKKGYTADIGLDYKNITKTLLLPYYIYTSKIYNNYITYYIRSIKRLQIILHTFDV